LIVGIEASKNQEIGRWLWALQDSRARTLRELEGLSPAALDWLPPDGESSIGSVLYHIADIEADWLYVEVLERDDPPEVKKLLPYPTRDEQGRLFEVQGLRLEQHLERLAAVRRLLLSVFEAMDLADFRRPRALESYDVTPEWVLHHLMQHEAEHRSQVGALKILAGRKS
jgi:uncharacterized damage-inducible protein DinB